MIHNKSQAKHHQILKPSYNAILPELGSLSKSKYGKACFFEIFFDFDPFLPITNACTTCLVAFSVCLVVLWEGSM